MKKFWSNYKQTIILLCSLVMGAIVGLVFKEKTAVLSPFGDLFMNMMFVIIVPLIFLTITTSIAKIKQPKRLGKVLGTIVGIFVVTSLVAVFVGLVSTYSFNSDGTYKQDIIMQSKMGDSEETKHFVLSGRWEQPDENK